MQYSTQSLSKLIFFLRIPLAMFKTHGKLDDFDKEILKVISSTCELLWNNPGSNMNPVIVTHSKCENRKMISQIYAVLPSLLACLLFY